MVTNKQFVGANYRAPMDDIAEVLMWEPKIVQCIQAFNEQDFIWYTLKSVYDEVDHIRVIEGAVGNQVNATFDGHSTDDTVKIIRDFMENEDPFNKVQLIQKDGPYESLETMKQTFLDYGVAGEWMLINDVDEIYQKEDIKLLRTAIQLYPTASEFVPLFLHYYRDFQTIAKPGPEWQPQHQRFFRFQPGQKYNSHPVVTDPQGHCTYFAPHYQNKRYIMPDWYVFHYGYARPNMDQVMRNKKEYYEKELAKHGGANKPFDEKVDIFLNKKEENENFCSFPLEIHPEIMKDHSMFSYKDERWEDKELQGWRGVEPYCLENVPNIWLWMRGLNPMRPWYSNQVRLEKLRRLEWDKKDL